MTKRPKRPAAAPFDLDCACATAPGILCAACARRGNAGWPIGSEAADRQRRLSPAARSRLTADEKQPDLFAGELRQSQRERERDRGERDRQYSSQKRKLARTAAGATEYEAGIKRIVKRLRV